MSEQQNYQAAKRRARELGRYYRHVMMSIAAVVFIGLVNLLASDHVWFQWPTLAVGGFLLLRTWQTFGAHALFGKEWEARKTAELMGEKPKLKKDEAYFEEVIQ